MVNGRDDTSQSREVIQQCTTVRVKKVQRKNRYSGGFYLFIFGEWKDYILILVGGLCSMLVGIGMPTFDILYGLILSSYTKDANEMVELGLTNLIRFVYIGAIIMVLYWVSVICWTLTGDRQTAKCRQLYLESIFNQSIGWFDENDDQSLTNSYLKDCQQFSGGVGQQNGILIMAVTTVIARLVISLIYGWKLTLVVITLIPLLMLCGYLYFQSVRIRKESLQQEYKSAGSRVQEAINGIKTVKMLNGEEYEWVNYGNLIQKSMQFIVKISCIVGVSMGSSYFCMFASFALSYWYGSRLMADGSYEVNNVITISNTLLMSIYMLALIGPSINKISKGKQACTKILSYISQQAAASQVKLQHVKGVVRFHNVTFSYPKRPDHIILNEFSCEFSYKRNGIVGDSGCGKSTIMQLILRFYEPNHGYISLDGVNISRLDIRWLRSIIGYIGQQPILYAMTIRENVKVGRVDATDEQIILALKQAQAYQFVMGLQNKLDTYVGIGGSQISGGQKQRIAIARALIKNPTIILLDEATSALDHQNQIKIQNTINQISQNIITIQIAHRISTIRTVQQIYVLSHGKLDEMGKYQQLSRYQQSYSIKQQPSTTNHHQSTNQALNQSIQHIKSINSIREDNKSPVFGRVLSYASDRRCIGILSIAASIINGCMIPLLTVFYSQMIAALLNVSEQRQATIRRNAIIVVCIGVGIMIFKFIQVFLFNILGEHITNKLRIQTYYKILRMPMKWFEDKANNAAQLTHTLQNDCQLINQLATSFIGIIIECIASLVIGVGLSIWYEWRTGLVMLAIAPLVALGHMAQITNTKQTLKQNVELVIMEGLVNIRTTIALNHQQTIKIKLKEFLQQDQKQSIRKGSWKGFFKGLNQLILFTFYGLIFWVGLIFHRDHSQATITNVMTAIYTIWITSLMIGNNSHFMPNTSEAKQSAMKLFSIIDSQDEDQIQLRHKSQMIKEGIVGKIQFKNVKFTYPMRKQPTLVNLSMSIGRGQQVGIGGASGSGKSTIGSLLMRFYDVDEGTITIDGVDIRNYDLHYLRSSIGLVNQQPLLFNATIKQNILYNQQYTHQQIRQVAKKVNLLNHEVREGKIELIHTQLGLSEDEGLYRKAGVKGLHFSGGEKQRVAIARTIIRNPALYIMDEATSALDSMNEKIIEEATSSITNKTIIKIAHKQQTMKTCDEIVVIDNGQVKERGSYKQLIDKQGYYYSITKGQKINYKL